jgi:beta-glucosidase
MKGIYSERMEVDYRWYTAHAVTPAFAFGHGLSYTAFVYSNLSVTSCYRISVTISNEGSRAGAEVAQLYVGFPEEAQTPPLQLKGFVKTKVLQPGESESVTFKPSKIDLSVWNVAREKSNWRQVHGEYKLFIGSSSSEIRMTSSCNI